MIFGRETGRIDYGGSGTNYFFPICEKCFNVAYEGGLWKLFVAWKVDIGWVTCKWK